MSAIEQTHKDFLYAIELKYGDPSAWTTACYTDAAHDYYGPSSIKNKGTLLYSSVPSMEIEPPERTGGFDKEILTILLPSDAFLAQLSSGEPHSKCYVTCWEIYNDGTSLVIFKGQIMKATKNPRGRSGLVKLEADTIKAHLDKPMGITADHECIWTFGDRNCRVVKATEEVVIDVINRKTLTLTSLTEDSPLTWYRGFMVYQGLRIMIRDWVYTNPLVFNLVKEPPSSWADQTVTIESGCDKSLDTCVTRWNNEARFMGLGYKMPKYNPLLES